MYLHDVLKKYLPILLIKIRYPGTQVGSHFQCSKNFTIFHGQKSVRIGNHCNLVDALINAGDSSTVSIGDYVFFGHGVKLLGRGHDVRYRKQKRQATITEKPITIGNGVWIATGSTILGGITIGDHAVIAAGSIVTKNVPPNTLVAGIPAKVVKKIEFKTNT